MAKSTRPTQSSASPTGNAPAQRSRAQYGAGGLVTLLLVLLYWWLTGSAPPSDLPAANLPATPVSTIAAPATATQPAKATAAPTTATPASRTGPAAAPRQERPTATPPPPTAAPTNQLSNAPPGMDIVTLDELPPEALETLELIEQDGPFPFRRDGITFQNREGLLPAKARGYYREYTVITPGEADRGARRIIGGEAGERYYTADHYGSFAWIELP